MDSKLIFLGDVYLKNKKNFVNVKQPYVFNYECVAARTNAVPMINKINLRGKQDFDGFLSLPAAVNLANNHILDYMDKGFEDTIKILGKYGIKYFGAGTSDNNYNNPCILNIGGKNIALLGYCDVYHSMEQAETLYGVARPDPKTVEQDIAVCRKHDISSIIVNIHWGREERFWNTERQQKLGRMCIDMGASLVIGHHPHCIQPVERYKNHFIFYSLGNAYFPDIAEPSYFNAAGKSEFVMHKKHCRYGRKSLQVEYDMCKNDVTSIHLSELKKNTMVDRGELHYNAVVPSIYRFRLINELSGYAHMLILFIRSYLFADGKLFSMKAIKKELEFLRLKRQGK